MNPADLFGRRAFLKKSSLLGAGLAAAHAGSRALAAGRSETGEVFRVGCLNVTTYSHLAGLWGPVINPRPDQKEIRLTDMRITHCWEIDHEKAKGFANTFGCEAVKNFDDMLGKVDGVISGGYYNHPWNHILHRPYLEAGLPNLINRPLSNSIAKAEEMVAVAKKHGATILTPSAFEHNSTMSAAKAWVRDKKVLCYNATNSFDDYPTHGIHGLYMIYRAIVEAGNPVESVAFRAEKWHKGPGVMTFEHRDASGRPFFGTLHQAATSLGTLRVFTPGDQRGEGFHIRIGSEEPYSKTELWAPTVWAFQRMARHGEMAQTFDQLLDRHRAFMAGWRSILVEDGRPVRLDAVPADWQSPVELPNQASDPTVKLFRKRFGEA